MSDNKPLHCASSQRKESGLIEPTGFHSDLGSYQRPLHINLEPSLLIGEPTIDQEHYDLAVLLNGLARHADFHSRLDTFSEIMSELGIKLISHFANEERIFQSFAMPESLIQSHLQAHTEIIERFTALNLDLMDGTVINRSEILLEVGNWIFGHFTRHDHEIRNYIPAVNKTDKQ